MNKINWTSSASQNFIPQIQNQTGAGNSWSVQPTHISGNYALGSSYTDALHYDTLVVRTINQKHCAVPQVFGRNFLIFDYPVSSGATFVGVAFYDIPEYCARVTPAQTFVTGATLSTGKYEYLGALVVRDGIYASFLNSTDVTGSNNAVSLFYLAPVSTFTAAPVGPFQRHIYRRQSGTTTYSGYWVLPNDTTMIDSGQPFDIAASTAGPPELGYPNLLNTTEGDNNYRVTNITTSWATTYAVHPSDIATTGFRVNFGTPATGSGTICCTIMRRG
jgi:hypothetical protein